MIGFFIYEYHHLKSTREPDLHYYLEKLRYLRVIDALYIKNDQEYDIYIKTKNLSFRTHFRKNKYFYRLFTYHGQIQKYHFNQIKKLLY